MKSAWFGESLKIAAIFAFRMLGLFMLIPVFTVYAHQLTGATPFLLGIALGGYGLTQGLLQIPFGMWSDRYGRKPLIAIGLCFFALGSFIGAQTHTILGMIIARVLQGAGAIGSVLIALLADITPEAHRTKAMAVIGATIGISFSLALVISPSISEYFGLAGIFYLTALFAGLGLLMLRWLPQTKQNKTTIIPPHQFKNVFCDPVLMRLNLGIFFQHFILVASFYVLPIILHQHIAHHHLQKLWQFYLPLMGFSFLLMLPCLLWVEKYQHIKLSIRVMIALMMSAQFLLIQYADRYLNLFLIMSVYFIAFNFMEALLPSLISKRAPIQNKGCAMGIYSSAQFLGIFVGGSLAGYIYSAGGATGVFMLNAGVSLIWLGIVCFDS